MIYSDVSVYKWLVFHEFPVVCIYFLFIFLPQKKYFRFLKIKLYQCTFSNPVLVFPCEEEDGHAICLDCFKAYCENRLNERAFISTEEHGYTLGCPGRRTLESYLSSEGTFMDDYLSRHIIGLLRECLFISPWFTTLM